MTEGDRFLEKAITRAVSWKCPERSRLVNELKAEGAVLVGGGIGLGIDGFLVHAKSQDPAILQTIPDLYKIGGVATAVVGGAILLIERLIANRLRNSTLSDLDLSTLEKALADERTIAHPKEITNVKQTADKISNYNIHRLSHR